MLAPASSSCTASAASPSWHARRSASPIASASSSPPAISAREVAAGLASACEQLKGVELEWEKRTAALRSIVTLLTQAAAADCLEEGCEIGTVESLLEQMKAEKNPSTKMLMTIKRLEVLIKSPEDNASDIEKLVSAAARSFSVVDTFNFPGEPIGYTGKVGTTTTAGKSLE